MGRSGTALAGLAVFCLAAAYAPAEAAAATVMQKAKRDGIFKVPPGDPQMLVAFARAQRTLDGFIDMLDGKIPGGSRFSVKIPIVDHGKTEYFWITNLSHVGGRFNGTVDNRPETVGTVAFGQSIAFPKGQIRDWSYVEDGRMQGNFTTCVLLGREDPAEAQDLKTQIGLTCDQGM